MAKSLFVFLDRAIIFLLFIFFITEHQVRFTAIKNISLYAALTFVIIMFFLNKNFCLNNIKKNFSHSKFAIFTIIIFVLYNFLISLFPYCTKFDSLSEAFEEFGRGLTFLFIILLWFDSSKFKINCMFYSVIAAFICISLYHSTPFFTNLDSIDNPDPGLGRIIKRSYADYVDRFLAFGLVGILLFKSLKMRIFIGLTCIILPIFMDALTGTRGSWLAGCITIVLFLIISYLNGFKSFYKNNIKAILSLICIGSIAMVIIFNNSSIVKHKILQGADPSGRNLIVEQRFPLLLKSNRAFWGLGYGKEQYDQFLRDQNDTGIAISMMRISKVDNKRFWWNDEPFFIGNYYYHGFIGTVALISLFIWILFTSYSKFSKTKDLFYLAIFLSAISYFGIRGIFESINLRILYMFYLTGFLIVLNAYYSKTKQE